MIAGILYISYCLLHYKFSAFVKQECWKRKGHLASSEHPVTILTRLHVCDIIVQASYMFDTVRTDMRDYGLTRAFSFTAQLQYLTCRLTIRVYTQACFGLSKMCYVWTQTRLLLYRSTVSVCVTLMRSLTFWCIKRVFLQAYSYIGHLTHMC